ncbi:MAG: hypothetical protein NUV54_03325, partial [Candidatus Taylorbacteria bacterium]|nr:hypothetical protein [Candidatus Taylorbacteria bacterium]
EKVADRVRAASPRSQVQVVSKNNVPTDWSPQLLGEHNRDNIACAMGVARAMNIPEETVKEAVELFTGVPGRLEYLRTVEGVAVYNDTNATTPTATIAALRALGKEKNIVLICGGTDKGLNMQELVDEIPKYCKAVILLEETGTSKIRDMIYDVGFKNTFKVKEEGTLKGCVEEAMKIAEKGDIVLFSPAFASFGKWFKNEYDRGNQFVELVRKL